KVEFMEVAPGAWETIFTEIIELLRLQIENSPLIIHFRRREVERVAQTCIDGEPLRRLPIILNKILLNMCSWSYGLLLQIYGEGLHLPKKKTREWIAGACGSG